MGVALLRVLQPSHGPTEHPVPQWGLKSHQGTGQVALSISKKNERTSTTVALVVALKGSSSEQISTDTDMQYHTLQRWNELPTNLRPVTILG